MDDWPKQDAEAFRDIFASEIDDADSLEADDLIDAVSEFVWENGDKVFDFSWDSGAPGAGAGVDSVYAWDDAYFVASGQILGVAGPFESLDEAVAGIGFDHPDGGIDINGATTAIRCSRWSDAELIRRLKVDARSQPKEVVINGTIWTGPELASESARLAREHARGGDAAKRGAQEAG